MVSYELAFECVTLAVSLRFLYGLGYLIVNLYRTYAALSNYLQEIIAHRKVNLFVWQPYRDMQNIPCNMKISKLLLELKWLIYLSGSIWSWFGREVRRASRLSVRSKNIDLLGELTILLWPLSLLRLRSHLFCFVKKALQTSGRQWHSWEWKSSTLIPKQWANSVRYFHYLIIRNVDYSLPKTKL